jgi:transcriptional repressor NrdR
VIASEEIGHAVLDVLREIHHVAYVRFASVYKGFTTPDDFARELAQLQRDAREQLPESPPSQRT